MKKNSKKIVEKIEILKQEIFSSPCPGQLTDCLLEADCQAKSRSRFYSGSPSWPARLPPRWPASEATWPTRSDLGPPCFGHKFSHFFFLYEHFFFKYLHFMYVCKYIRKKINWLSSEAVPHPVLPGAVPWPVSAPILNDILLRKILWSKK